MILKNSTVLRTSNRNLIDSKYIVKYRKNVKSRNIGFGLKFVSLFIILKRNACTVDYEQLLSKRSSNKWNMSPLCWKRFAI